MATVAKTPRTTTYTLASAGVGPFLTGFRIFEGDAIEVYIDGEVSDNWSMSATFSDGYDDNSSIIFDDELAVGTVIHIDGATPVYRDYDYLNGDPGLSRKANIELGRLWASVSEIAMKVGRSVRLFSNIDPITLTEGQTVIFEGGAIVPGPTADEISGAQGYAEDALAARNLAQAWAESTTTPNPLDPTSKSAKTWAGEAEAARDEILGLSADATTLAPGASATASYNPGTGVLELGIPEGEKGDKGDKGDIGEPGPGGDVNGPASAVANRIAVFDGITGKLLKDGETTISQLAPTVSPVLTGTPTAPTAAPATNTTQIATTAFVLANAPSIPSQTQGTWNGGSDPTESIISAEKLDDKIENKLNVTGDAPMYACRAWVNFNSHGTVAIRAAGNVSSITDNGAGDFTVNFTTAMPDANYSVVGFTQMHTDVGGAIMAIKSAGSTSAPTLMTTSAVRLVRVLTSSGAADTVINAVAVFR